MSKLHSLPPFSPAKGKAQLDPAFEFEAPRYCDLLDENYDFYEDYEKNIWFEETHWMHEPPEKRPVSDKSKRKSISNFAAAAALAKRQLTAILGDASPDLSKLRYIATRADDESGKTEGGRGSSGSFERDSNFSPSRVFAPVSENSGGAAEVLRKARYAAANSPAKLRGPERILFPRDSSDKENFPNEELDVENIKPMKARKSSANIGRISDGKAKETGKDEENEANEGKVKTKVATEGKGAISRKSAEQLKRKSSGDGGEVKAKVLTRKSGDGKTQIAKSRKSIVSVVEEKEKSGRMSGGSAKIQKKAETDKQTATKKAESEKGIVKGEPEQKKVKTEKQIATKKVEGTEAAKVEETEQKKPTKKVESEREKTEVISERRRGEERMATKRTEQEKPDDKEKETEKEKEKEKERRRERKSISSLAFLNSHSTTFSVPLPFSFSPDTPSSSSPSSSSSYLLPPSSSFPFSSLSLPKSKSELSMPLASTLPFLDAAKPVTSLPTRVRLDEIEAEENEEIKEERSEERNEDAQEEGERDAKGEKERQKKRKSDEAIVGEKPKRTRSSIMTCPVPAKKKLAPLADKYLAPAPAPAPPKEKKVVKAKPKYEFELDENVAALLEKHNKKFKPKVAYVPRNFSTKDVKMWEEYSGKKWYSLTAAEREEANDWIKHTKQNN